MESNKVPAKLARVSIISDVTDEHEQHIRPKSQSRQILLRREGWR
ncbi:hypothetical protein [Sporisorium scitamineum]|uniref:Uncharacterized protein n=1 Tax=Sporisorium scitamineum TaxID=49012 RepID=A0A0F7S0V1_9BASI|nr:hypothetical protein [Sporisorium scitamineum]